MTAVQAGTDFQFVRVESEGAARTLILDRPPLNVLNIEMLDEVAAALAVVASDPAAAVLTITGEGKAFSAGVDVADHTEDKVDRMIESLHGALGAVLSLELPVVAAVNGAALGGGLELALACDVVLARSGAKLGQPEVRLGVFPPFAAAVLPRLIGRAAARDLCLSGRTITAEDGMMMGLVQQVFPADDFARSVTAYAGDIAASSPAVLKIAKRALVLGERLPLRDAFRMAEQIYSEDLMKLDDAAEGIAAFMEKRDPVWKGA